MLALFLGFLAVTMADVACTVTETEESSELVWSFDLPGWSRAESIAVGNQWNFGIMGTGNWSYEMSFCQKTRAYMGDVSTTPEEDLLGWNFGILSSFQRVNALVNTAMGSEPVLMFNQTYTSGDTGAPCSANVSRSSVINIWCGMNGTCLGIPNTKQPQCIDYGSPNVGFCLCSIEYQKDICSGLVFNVLSNKCPDSQVVPISPVVAPLGAEPGKVAGTLSVVITVIICISFVGATIYNHTVHDKHGLSALPFYDSWCRDSSKIEAGSAQFKSVPSPTSAIGYGSVV